MDDIAILYLLLIDFSFTVIVVHLWYSRSII